MKIPAEHLPLSRASERRWRALGCGGTTLLFGAVLSTYVAWAHALPGLEPTPVRILPSSNGYDAYVRSALSLKVPRGLDDETVWTTDLPALRKVVAPYRSDLKGLRAAARLPYMTPVGGADRPIALSSVCVLLAAEARIALAEGEPSRAMDIALDVIELGAKYGRGGSLIETMVGTGVGHLGCRAAQPALDGLTLHDTRTAIARLDRILREFPRPAEVMDEERRLYVGGIQAEWGAPAQRLGVRRNGEPSWLLDGKEEAARLFYPRSWGFRRIDDYYCALTRELRKPLPQRVPPPLPMDPVLNFDPAPFEVYQFHLTQPRVHPRLLRMQLALREFRLRTGRYPASLQEMSTGPLPEAALDPFTETAFRYRRTGSGYVLYSTGPDGRDDGGTPTPSRRLGRHDTRGDVVAGHFASPATSRRRRGEYRRGGPR